MCLGLAYRISKLQAQKINVMKLYILLAFLVLGLSPITKAQQKMPTAQEMTVKSVDELEKRLKLTPTQKSVIYNYVFDMSKQQLDLIKRQQAGTSKEDDVTKFYKLQNDTNDNIRTILKGDQLPEFEKVLEDRLNGGNKKKKKKGKGKEEEEVVTGISGLKLESKP
jgi:protein CpxP